MKSWIAALALALTPALAAAQYAPLPAREALLGDIEAWRSVLLPQTTPMHPFTAKYQPRLDDIKKTAAEVRQEKDLAKPRKDFTDWRALVQREAHREAASMGLTSQAFDAYAAEQGRIVEVVLMIGVQAEKARVEAEVRRVHAFGATTPSKTGQFFDASGFSPFADASVVSSGPELAFNDPARYKKMRDLLISQGASAKVVDAAIAEGIRQKVDPHLVLSVIWKESAFKTRAYNKGSGATGLMQLLPSTARDMGVTGDLFDMKNNLKAGVRYLKWIANDYFKMGADLADTSKLGESRLKTILASYNAGIGNVRKWLRRQGDALTRIPFAETRDYVAKIADKIGAWLGLD